MRAIRFGIQRRLRSGFRRNPATLQFKPHEIPVVFDKEDFHKARGAHKAVNYLYADGHIKNLLTIEGTK